jgi:hypothetical protein
MSQIYNCAEQVPASKLLAQSQSSKRRKLFEMVDSGVGLGGALNGIGGGPNGAS